ncbi:unnamed protein product [Somion occarium]|uniref:CMP/dCMP-type deaminase domain-containing protein n=1 Tax=Somion occarium TaxID=3059160 RepID=A0ABP1CND6_9APHY
MSVNVLSDHLGMSTAILEAKQSRKKGGIPIGSAIVYHGDSAVGPQVLGSGHNQRIQKSSAILHGEIAALDSAGRQKPEAYRNSTIYTTLSMCTGAILLYRIPRVVIGESRNFRGDEDLLRSRGVEVVVLDNNECYELMKEFIETHPEEWNEDIGETVAPPS